MFDSNLTGTSRFSMWRTFENVTPGITTQLDEEQKRTKIRDDIQTVLSAKRGAAIGLELGGLGSKLFDDFDPGFFEATFGATLEDTRGPRRRRNESRRKHHTVIEANVFSLEGIEEIKRRLPGGKADLIIERMGGPMGNEKGVLSNIFAIGRLAQAWYRLLNNGGIMYIQLPQKIMSVMDEYVHLLKTIYGNSIEISLGIDTSKDARWPVMRLVKSAEAPQELPLLNPLAVRKTLQENQENQEDGVAMASALRYVRSLPNSRVDAQTRENAARIIKGRGDVLFFKTYSAYDSLERYEEFLGKEDAYRRALGGGILSVFLMKQAKVEGRGLTGDEFQRMRQAFMNVADAEQRSIEELRQKYKGDPDISPLLLESWTNGFQSAVDDYTYIANNLEIFVESIQAALDEIEDPPVKDKI